MTDFVYVISSGSYDDYRVHCVVKGGKREANTLAARANSAGGDGFRTYRVEALPVVDVDVQPVEILRMSQDVWDDGTYGPEKVLTSVEWPFDLVYEDHNVSAGWRWVRAPIHNGKGGRLEVYGTDHDLVRSLMVDMRARLLADGKLRKSRGRTGTAVPSARIKETL